MSESVKTAYTAEEIVWKWADNMAQNARHHHSYDETAYEARRGFYANEPGLDKYKALMAYLECYPLHTGTLDFISPDEELEAWQRTFGLVELDQSREALKAILDDHYQALGHAYEAELKAFTDSITL